MLGANGVRRYFVSVQTPSESTGDGGFMGNWAEVTADHGRIELAKSGRNRDLTEGGADPAGRRIESEPEFVRIYGQNPAQYWGAINFSPDHPTVSRVMAELYPKSGGEPLDGVISVTPAAFAAFLQLTGPIEVPGYPERLTPENAEQILLFDQYVQFPKEQSEDRQGFVSDAVNTLFDRLTSGELPGPSALAKELGPAVESRNLQLWSAHPEEESLFERLGAAGDATRDSVDSFGVVTDNLNGNKIDWFLHRDMTYEAEWDPKTGEVSGTVSVDLHNEAPATGLPHSIIGWGGDVSLGQTPVADGENLMMVTMYATFPIDSITVDGEPVDFTPETELGHHTGRFYLSVPSGGTRRVVAHFTGTAQPSTQYVARPIRQPMVNPDNITVRLALPSGWAFSSVSGGDGTGDGTATVEATAADDIRLTAEAERSGSRTLLDRLRGIG